MDNRNPGVLFELFNEIGIIEQLSRALLEARLPDGLIAPHFGVLNHLSRGRDGATPVEMARAFQVPKTSMTHTLKGLEQGGYVTLKPNPEDGRSKQVWMTEKGQGLLGQTIQALAPDLMELMGRIDVERLMAIKPVLTDLRITLDEARD